MTLSPRLRKLALTLHVTFSVGWLGAVAAYLALAIAGLTSSDPALARAAYPSMELIAGWVIVPCSLAALVTGLVQSLSTEWGLVRHYWVLLKLLLSSVGTLILLVHLRRVSQMSRLVTESAVLTAEAEFLKIPLVVHAAGGLLVLLTATALSFYKPWGRTPYGRRRASRPS